MQAVNAAGQMPVAGVPSGPVLSIQYRGTGGSLFVLAAKNLLLTLVTLGVYLPWARTERRKYLWQNLEIGGHGLRYHGTGVELLLGFLKVLAVYAVVFGVPFGIRQVADETTAIVAQGIGIFILILIIPFAIYGSRRYRLSRTSLRGVRFGLEPGVGAYYWMFIGGYFLTILTLGIYGPIWQNRLYHFLMKRTRYGSQCFDYDGPTSEALRIGVVGALLTLVTFGIYGPWFMAKRARFRAEHTIFQGARGRLEVTGGELFKLFLIAYVGVAASFGIAFPWISTMVMQTLASKLTFVGPIDYSRIERRSSDGSAAADDMAGALDVGLQL